MRLNYLLLFLAFLVVSCSGNKPQSDNAIGRDAIDSVYTVKYAKGFSVKVYADYKEVMVRDPWDTTQILQRYILVDKNKELPANLPEGIVIRTPLTDVVAYSTIHCATLEEIGALKTIRGVCEPDYIDIPYIQEELKKGTIVDLGQAANPIVEKIVDLSPEAIWATPIQGRTYGSVTKTGVPIIETPDYMEPTPLGRAEWIRFYALFFNKEAHVDSLFEKTVNHYNEIKEKVANVSERPTVFLDLMYRGVWYTSGGDSFISKMLNDAGATYVWNDDKRVESKPLAFEQVLEKAGDAQFWLIKYNKEQTLTYKGLESEYKPYSYFEAFKNRKIYECNSRVTSYYEDLPIHPDYILQDFAYVFHPDLFPDYIPRYYSPMKE